MTDFVVWVSGAAPNGPVADRQKEAGGFMDDIDE
jgi:hypothetical protein